MSSTLVRVLSIEDKPQYRSMIRMTEQDFDYLLNLVTPMIRKEDTLIRECISGRERLEVMLAVTSRHVTCSAAENTRNFLIGRYTANTGRVHGCPVHTARVHGPC